MSKKNSDAESRRAHLYTLQGMCVLRSLHLSEGEFRKCLRMIHPKKGSPSGRNAYLVTEKKEELKRRKNDMAKKKTFQEYTKEALYEIEKTEAALKQAKLEKEQAEHRIQRSLNYLDTQKKKKRKARTHLLIQKGAVIEAICKDTKYLTEAEFYQLMDELLHDPACKFCDVVHEMVRGRAETAEAKEREFEEEEALLKAMQRGELPQGDE